MIADPVVRAGDVVRSRRVDARERTFRSFPSWTIQGSALSRNDLRPGYVARCVGTGHDPTDLFSSRSARTDTPIVKPDTELKDSARKAAGGGDHHVRSTIVV